MASMSTGAIITIAVLEGVGIATSVLVFGLTLLVPIFVGLVITALVLKGAGVVATFILSHICFGLIISALLYGPFLFWVVGLIGVGAIAVIVLHFVGARKQSTEVMGDA